MTRAGLAGLLALLCGCSTPSAEDAGGPRVRGDFIQRHLLADGGVLLVPELLGARTLTFFLEADDGGFETVRGEGFDDGTFSAPVPEGRRYTLHLGNLWIQSDARALHLGSNVLGRPGVFQANVGEGLALSLTNLAPWSDDDALVLASWNAGLGYFSTSTRSPPFAANAPAVGDTRLDDATIDLEGEVVFEAAHGDDVTLIQLAGTRTDAGVVLKQAVRALRTSVTLDIGQPTPLHGALETLETVDATFTLAAGAFAAHADGVGPHASPFTTQLLVDAHPGRFGDTTWSGATPDLAVAELPPETEDVTLSLRWSDPFGARWTPFVAVVALYDVPYAARAADGGDSFERSELGYVSVALPLELAKREPITPMVTPVLHPTLDGRPADVALDDVDPTAHLRWTLPAVGTPRRIEVEAVRLEATPQGGTRRTAVGTLRVTGAVDGVRLPPGFLDPGDTYYLRITALALPDGWDATSPLLDVGPPAGAASASTARFTVRQGH